MCVLVAIVALGLSAPITNRRTVEALTHPGDDHQKLQDSGLLDVLVPRLREGTRHQDQGDCRRLGCGAANGIEGRCRCGPGARPQRGASVRRGRRPCRRPGRDAQRLRDCGPAGSAGIGSLASVNLVMPRRGTPAFVPRGDDSGTHAQELTLWAAARIDPRSIARRGGDRPGDGSDVERGRPEARVRLRTGDVLCCGGASNW